jgi:hypothetical protein
MQDGCQGAWLAASRATWRSNILHSPSRPLPIQSSRLTREEPSSSGENQGIELPRGMCITPQVPPLMLRHYQRTSNPMCRSLPSNDVP